MDGNFTGSCFEYKARNLDNIADIPALELCKNILADVVHSHIRLYSAVSVLNINEVSLAHITPCHNSSGNSYFFIFKIFKIGLDFVAVMSLSCNGNFKRVVALILQFSELINSNLLLLVFG